MDSIEDRALRRYFRTSRISGVSPEQPMSGGVKIDHRRARIVIRNGQRVLAVYTFKDHGTRVTFKDATPESADARW